MPVDVVHAGKIASRLGRKAAQQLTPAGRRRRALERAAIDAPTSRPGLHHVDEQGVVVTCGCRTHQHHSDTLVTPPVRQQTRPAEELLRPGCGDTERPAYTQPVGDAAARHEHDDEAAPVSAAAAASECTPVEVAYYRVGPRVTDDNHTTVVFVHGFTLASDSFFLQVDYLQTVFPEVTSLLVDVRGHGRTGKVAPSLCTVEGTADDVLATIAMHAPRGRLILVGHSLGGMTVLNLLRRADSSVQDRVAGVLLLSTAIESLASQGLPQVLASPVANLVHDQMEIAPELAREFRTQVAELLAPTLAATVFYRDSTPYDIIEFHASMIHDTPLETIVGFFDDLQEHEETAAGKLLRRLDGACVVGDKDHFTPLGQTDLICRTWTRATRHVLRGVGHMVILEAPELVNRELGRLVARTLPALTSQ
ncbi:alpha/beta fold hydrolase [Corynebacterium sp. 13CS0277]|uniref:alpha/beta fold hydrolase n=1 Tax=Corynebacterium sp. 13CS0277 TaxID=2071994 RepID=UPI0013047ED8|nr:alpha/beta hydrolase [Corynebacterium sp. 13CS0277]